MKEAIVKVYTFEELSDAAKEKARIWWRECESQNFGAFGEIYEPAETAAKLLGIEFEQKAVKLMGGGTRQESQIYWSGFSSQGDGASFVGSYSYKKGSAKAVRAEFGHDEKLWRIADGLAALQKRHGYQLEARISHEGHYSHSYTMSATVNRKDTGNEASAEVETELLELMRDFANWIYRGLEGEYEYRMSDENVDESIEINEYEFTEDGKRWWQS